MSTNQRTPFLWTLKLNTCVWRTLWRGPCAITAPLSLRGRKKKAPRRRGWRRIRKTKQEPTLRADSPGASSSGGPRSLLLDLAGKRRQELQAKEPGARLERCGHPGWRGRPGAASSFPRRQIQVDPWGLPPRVHHHPNQDFPFDTGLRDSSEAQQGTPNTNLSPASEESTQPLLFKKKKKERKKNVPFVRTQQEPCLTASSPARLAFLIWRIRQAHTEAGRSRPARSLGRGVGGPRTALGRQPISPKNRNPRRHPGRCQSPRRWMNPGCTWTRSGQVVGGHLVYPHALTPRTAPHPSSHLCSGSREKDPPTYRLAPPLLPQAPARGGQGRASLEGDPGVGALFQGSSPTHRSAGFHGVS